MNPIKSLFLAFLISFLCVGLSAEVFATPQQFSAEGEYRLGDRDTREDAKKYAIAEAKRKVAEQAGVYVESYTEINNFHLSKDKISVVAQTLMTIKSERTEFTENGVVCKAYVTAVIDPESVEKKLLDMIRKKNEEEERLETKRQEEERRANERREKKDKPTNISNPTVDNTTPRERKRRDIRSTPPQEIYLVTWRIWKRRVQKWCGI